MGWKAFYISEIQTWVSYDYSTWDHYSKRNKSIARKRNTDFGILIYSDFVLSLCSKNIE
jgi:hypothetical protein